MQRITFAYHNLCETCIDYIPLLFYINNTVLILLQKQVVF